MSKTNPARPYTWATDATFSSGDASGRDTKTAPAGAPDVAQGFVPGTAGASPHLNWAKNLDGKWLNFLKDIQIANWTMFDISGDVTNTPRAGCFVSNINSSISDVWVLVGDEETITFTDGTVIGSVTATGLDFVSCFASTNNGGCAVGLQGTDVVAECNGASWSTNTETTNDELWVGVQDVDSGNDVIAGFLAGTNLGFIYGTSTGNSDLNRSADTFGVPDLGGPPSPRSNVDQKNIHIAQDGAGRILCLVSYHGVSSGRVDQLISTNGGVNWTQTTDVISSVGTALTTGVSGLAWDAENNQWVALTFDGRTLTAAAAGSSSWTEVNSGTDIFGVAVTDAERIAIDGGIWIVLGNIRHAWSRDGGTTWSTMTNPATGNADGSTLVYSPERGQWLVGCTKSNTSDAAFALSLAVGP